MTLDLYWDEWQTAGACRTGNPEMTRLFFPQRGESTRPAKAVCRTCPVMEQCREHALVNNEKHGIWGGMSERERRAERKRRKAAGTLVAPGWQRLRVT